MPEVRVIIDDGESEEENLGVLPTAEALRLAQERGLDLVEVAPQAQPPVCKVMDYGRFKYLTERKAREAHRAGKAGRAASEMKDVQLSPRIDEHDMNFKVERAREFLNEGHPVRMVVRFLGRDMRHPEVGMRALQQALEVLGSKVPIMVVQQPRMEGRQLFALIRLAKGAKAGANVDKAASDSDAALAAAPAVGGTTPSADGAATATTAATPEPVPAAS